jgi:hypothetical protein
VLESLLVVQFADRPLHKPSKILTHYRHLARFGAATPAVKRCVAYLF